MRNRNETTASDAYNAGQGLASSGKDAEAIQAYSLSLDLQPNHVKARFGRGLAFQRVGQHASAIADFDATIACCSNWSGAYLAYYARAVSHRALGNNLKAIDDCNQLLKTNPEYKDALYLRGTAWKALGNFESAMNDMDAVLEFDPSYQEAYVVRGSLRCLSEQWEKAVTDLTIAIEYLGDNTTHIIECYYLRAMAARQLGDLKMAIKDLTRAIELAPRDSAAYLRRSQIYREMGDALSAHADLQVAMRALRGQRQAEEKLGEKKRPPRGNQDNRTARTFDVPSADG